MTDSAKSVAVIGGSFLGSELATAMAFKGNPVEISGISHCKNMPMQYTETFVKL